MALKGFYKKHGKTHPITESKGKTSQYSGQKGDPSWKASSIRDLRKDEAKASDKYWYMSKTAPTEKDAKTMRTMSQNEADHEMKLSKMKGQKPNISY